MTREKTWDFVITLTFFHTMPVRANKTHAESRVKPLACVLRRGLAI